MDYAQESLKLHGRLKGKIEVISKVRVENKEDLLACMALWQQEFEFAAVLPLSALTGDGTDEMLDELSKYGAHATFFVVGNRVDGTDYNGKAGLQHAIAAGNEIGIHGYTHKKYYDNCSDADYEAELSKTLNAIWDISSDTPVSLMRPVGGRISNVRADACEYAIIMWDVDSLDWKYK